MLHDIAAGLDRNTRLSGAFPVGGALYVWATGSTARAGLCQQAVVDEYIQTRRIGNRYLTVEG
jgi:hypothetical protein